LNVKYDYIIPSGSYCYDEKFLKKIDKKKLIVDDSLSIVSNKDDEIVKRTILTAQNWLKYDDKTIYDLSGRQVNHVVDGQVYIQNGKKKILK
jgi:hypothetical protein